MLLFINSLTTNTFLLQKVTSDEHKDKRERRENRRIKGRSSERGNEWRVDNVDEPLSSPHLSGFSLQHTYTAPDFSHPSFECLLLLTVFVYAKDGNIRKGSRLIPSPSKILSFSPFSFLLSVCLSLVQQL